MKRTLLVITCVLASIAMLAQDGVNDYLPFVDGGKSWIVARINGKNNIDKVTYRIQQGVEEVNINGNPAGRIFYMMKTFLNDGTEFATYLIHEENRKVYLDDPSCGVRFLLFDYSLEKGDTYETYSYDEGKMVTYKVLSVDDYIDGPEVIRYDYDEVGDSTVKHHRYLRKWTVERTDNEYHNQKTWIEGVGSLEGPLANLYDARPISSRDYLTYVCYNIGEIYLPFSFYDIMVRVWHGCNLPTGAEDNWESDRRNQLTYELEGDRLHVYGEVFTQCGPNNYAYFKKEPTDDPLTYKIRFYIEEVEPLADCMALHTTDFYVPGFDPNLNYIVVDNQGEEHPVINKNPQMAYRSFVEEGKVWMVEVMAWPPSNKWLEYYYLDGDTIVNGQKAKRMMRDVNGGESWLYEGAWYEQDKKVYYAPYNGGQQFPFELLYDFTLSSGDSITSPDNTRLVVNKLSGGIPGFKGTYYEIGQGAQIERWLEGVGSESWPNQAWKLNGNKGELIACTVGDEVIYYDSKIEDPFNMGAKKRRFDFNHTIKTQPKAPRRAGELDGLYGEYNDELLDVKLNPLDDAYLVRITDKAGEAVYEKTINAGNIVALNIDISEYPDGQYTVTIENSQEVFTGMFDTTATAIEETPSDSLSMGRGIFNLQGQRISMPQKGLNIVDGMKIWVK